MKLFLFLAIICSYGFTWSPEQISHWDKISTKYLPQMTTSPFSTFWGGFRRTTHWASNKGNMVNMTPQGFLQPVPVYVQSNNKKRDLVIFYPGVFGKPDGKISPQVIDELEKRDVHVAAVPNLLATTYLTSRPKVKGDPFAAEKENQQQIFLEIIKTVKVENINKIHVVAESLGCLQAMTTLTPHSPGPIEVDSITLLWPALYLDRAVKRFDFLIAKSVCQHNSCTYWWKWPFVAFEVLNQTVPTGLSNSDKECLGAWGIAVGFVEAISKTSVVVAENDSVTLKHIPETFTQFVETVTPEMKSHMQAHDKRLSLDYLLGLYQKDLSKIRFVSSVDDFLNTPQEWETLKSKHPLIKSQVYLFSWGGHSGPVGMDGFVGVVFR
jgi:hypothetical protein